MAPPGCCPEEGLDRVRTLYHYAGIARVRDEVMPALQAMDGCIGMSLLVDRESGQCIATSAWEAEQALRASAEKVRQVRDRAAETAAGSATVAEWEIAVLQALEDLEGFWRGVGWAR